MHDLVRFNELSAMLKYIRLFNKIKNVTKEQPSKRIPLLSRKDRKRYEKCVLNNVLNYIITKILCRLLLTKNQNW